MSSCSTAITSRLTANKSAIDGYSGLHDRITRMLHETLDTLTAQNLRKMITIYCGSEMTTKDVHTFMSSFSLVDGDEIERVFLAELGLNKFSQKWSKWYVHLVCRAAVEPLASRVTQVEPTASPASAKSSSPPSKRSRTANHADAKQVPPALVTLRDTEDENSGTDVAYASDGGSDGGSDDGSDIEAELGGAAEDQELGGAVEGGELGGAAEGQELGGAAESQELGGAAENDELGTEGENDDADAAGDLMDVDANGKAAASDSNKTCDEDDDKLLDDVDAEDDVDAQLATLRAQFKQQAKRHAEEKDAAERKARIAKKRAEVKARTEALRTGTLWPEGDGDDVVGSAASVTKAPSAKPRKVCVVPRWPSADECLDLFSACCDP